VPTPTAGAIYNSGTGFALFEDPKARVEGDLLTVLLVEKTQAQKKASTSTSKDTSIDIANPTLFGRPLSRDGTPLGEIGVSGSRGFDGKGDTSQSNQLSESITVTVVERLPNGNEFVGWGSQRWFTEFSPTGEVLFDGHLARGNDNYRAFRYEWTGRPSQPPKVIASAVKSNITARVSWNGATDVARWELLAGADANSLVPIGSAARTDFETAVTAKSTAAQVALRAYDAAGNVLGTSVPIKPTTE